MDRVRVLSAVSLSLVAAVLLYSMSSPSSPTHAEAFPEGPLNVLGSPLEVCSTDPLTGYMRDGYCKLASFDRGTHVVCAQVTSEFLEYTRSRGNDLSTPAPEYMFPGLKDGDRWCLCVLRWLEAYKADPSTAPPVVLGSTHKHALDFVPIETLQEKSVFTQ